MAVAGNAGTDDGAARSRARRGDEGIGAVINIEHGALRTFEHHGFAAGDRLVQQQCRVGDERGYVARPPPRIGINLVGIERLGC